MSPVQLRLSLLGLCTLALIPFVLCSDERNNQHDSSQIEGNFNRDQQNGVPIWPWGGNFKCPSAFGSFPDPEDCSYFYICVAKRGTRKKCPRLQQFDKNLRRCISFIIAVCDDSGKKKTTPKVTNTEGTTPKDAKFTCPNIIGTFVHPEDCSKYYSCTFFIPTLKTCPLSELFDGVKKLCRAAKEVHCGSRINPNDASTTVKTTPEISTTLKTTPEISTTVKTTPEITTPPTSPEITSETVDRESTPTITDIDTESSSVEPPVTAPDTDCEEDDLDCIIDDLGEKPEWFVCRKDMGSYPHPSSRKLFIFCLNWKPSVKKCGQDLVFSDQLMTCVSP